MLTNTHINKIKKTKVIMINHSQQLVDKYPLLNCTNCGTPSPTTQQQGNFIDDGISINTLSLGHYGGFTDCIPDQSRGEVYSIGEYDSNPYLAHLCHDCTVIMFNALPGLAKFAGVHGGHGNITGGWCFSGGELSHIENGTLVPPCCPYAWTWDQTEKSGPYNQSTTYLSTPELTWVKKEYEDDDLEH
jgi:hypothetical protein